MVEVGGLPACRLEDRLDVQFSVGRSRTPILLVAVADAEIESIRILDLEAVEVLLRVVIGNRIESARLQRLLDLFQIPRLNPEAEAVPHGLDRTAVEAAPAFSIAAALSATASAAAAATS